jgi:urease accessory protein
VAVIVRSSRAAHRAFHFTPAARRHRLLRMAWHARLNLDYRLDESAPRTLRRSRHDGPLRVLKSLHPEGDAVCHDVVVHPPGGLVGGDALVIEVDVDAGAHALLTTPSAARFYRSTGAPASQAVRAQVAAGARLEWLPLETLVYSGARAESRLAFTLAPGAEMIGWDLVALGQPASDAAFVAGTYAHEIALPGRWLDRGRTSADDHALLDGPAGWDGCRAMGTMWFAAGGPLAPARETALLDAARTFVDAHPLALRAGVTAAHEGLVVMRVLADRVEPAFDLMRAVWRAWRPLAWDCAPVEPRVWRT